MRVFREAEESDFGKDALTFALGAVGGLAVGLLMSRRAAPAGRLGAGLRQRARTVAGRLRPARLQRMDDEQADLALLEDAVLDAFLSDGLLSERGVDIGAVSPGIVELSGSVWSEEEAEHAVHTAQRIPGVATVVNRLEVEDETRRIEQSRRRREEEGSGIGSLQHRMARTGGMGRRRQGRDTDPDTRDDSQSQEIEALREADLAQLRDEDISTEQPRTAARETPLDENPTGYPEDELDNQDPHGKHAPVTLDEQPQELNTDARVGTGLKPGVELALEEADVPMRPHGAEERDSSPS